MDKEIKFIGGVVNDPHKPVVAIFRLEQSIWQN